jgi:hypothetical protein
MTSAADMTSNDLRLLRTIPEDRSDVASSLQLAAGQSTNGQSAVASSVRGLDAGREGSIVSTAHAELADGRRPSPATPPQGPNRRRRRRRGKFSQSSLCVLLSTLLVVAGAVVAIVLVTISDSGGSTGTGNGTVTLTLSPASSPTMSPTVNLGTVQALDDILMTLLSLDDLGTDIGTSSSFDDLDPSDPRALARDWMLTKDLLRDDLLAANEASLILQRFALAELYFATNGDFWAPEDIPEEDLNSTVPFLQPEDSECNWQGVTCVEDVSTFLVVRRLVLNNQNLTGTLPASLYVLKDLGELSFADNNLTGPIPSLWFQEDDALGNLFVLDLDDNDMTGAIPTSLWTLPLLRYVYLNENVFTGSLESVDTADTLNDNQVSVFLEEVWLYGNDLSGSLPVWLYAHPRLAHFLADHNRFSGSLPSPGKSFLEYVDLSFNELSGPLLPDHVPSTMQALFLDNNFLTGPLPASEASEFSPWQLQELWLQDNQIDAEVLPSFGALWPLLRVLRMTGNDLRGDLSTQCKQLTNLETVEVDCNQNMTCSCCTNEDCL